jgi:tellurite resistance protein TehA-like permease
MAELLAELAPLVLAAAISPATIGIVILILATTERPLLRASAFAAGFALVLVPATVIGLILLRGARESLDEGSPLFAWIDISMGAALLVVTAVSLTRQGDVGAAEERVRTVSPAAFLILGMAMMFGNLNSLAVGVPMLHEIAIAEVNSFERGLALALSDLVILLPVVAPIAVVAAAPRAAEHVLPRIRGAVDRYGFRVGVVVFSAIGLYLLVKGLIRL